MPDKDTHNKIPIGFKLRHTLQHTLSWSKNIVLALAWSPDGLTLASTGEDKIIRLWDVATGKLHLSLEGHFGRVYSVAWSPDGRTLASGSNDSSVRLWDPATGQSRRSLEGHFSRVYSVAWSPDGLTLASGGNDSSARLWDPVTGRLRRSLEGHSGEVYSVAWSPGGLALASASKDETVRLWDPATGQLRRTLKGHSGGVYSVAWSPNGQTLASAGEDRTVRLWDPATGRPLILEGHTGPISAISFSSDGQYLASKSADQTIWLWRCDKRENVAVLNERSQLSWLTNLTFHPNIANVLATPSDADRAIRIWDLDFEAILDAAPKREAILYTTAKITLVGDSGAGKTGLGWRLAHGVFKEHPSTHGQQFWVIDELGAIRDDRTQCEAVLWDLAGQPDYRLVHALFLDDVDLALVLFDPTNLQEPLKGVEYWLKQLSREKREGRMRHKILVGARADRGVPTLTPQELKEFCVRHGVDGGYVSTSALTGEGLAELFARMKSLIVWDQMTATVTTKTFKRIKDLVLVLKADDERKSVLVSPRELRARLQATDVEWKFSDVEIMTAAGHLSNHGYVSVLRGSSGEETILLAPDLLTNLASSFVLEARRNEKGLGALEEARVLRGEYQLPELAVVEKQEGDVLLDAAVVLFLEKNLCFRETLGPQTLLIFPALINQKRPQLDEVETVEDFSYHLSGAVENVYAALVVQLGYTNTFTRTNQWQNQAEYETARGDVCGFRQVDEREGEVVLVLYYVKEKPGARLLFQGLFEEFLRGRDVSVTKFPPIPCPNCGYRQQRGEVVKRIGEGKGFLFCGECGENIPLPKEGEKVMLKHSERDQLNQDQERMRRRTSFEAALVRVKAIARDEKKLAPSCFVSYAWGNAGQERWVRELGKDLENAGIEVILDRKDNAQIGANVARFVSRIEQSDFVVVIGTPLYRQKYENKVSEAGSIVAAEVNLIHLRLTGTNEEAATVLPLLLEGTEKSSLPPLVRGKVYGKFIEESLYFATLFELILTLYRIPFEHPAVNDLRESLRAQAER